ncbi:MAG TPA: tRNA (adenosine(37)-N6)-dimethylallyltransferase MiaA [Dongiaceae bacterium]
MSDSTNVMASADIGEAAEAHKREGAGHKRPVLVVAGPTASGKSALALRLARDFDGIVINADSMQVYRDLPILTAQPSDADMTVAPHRLYGFLALDDVCSAERWAGLARQEIDVAHGSGKLPILCGGTGLYLRALMHGFSPIPDVPADVRKAARALLDEIGSAALRERLAAGDPASAARLHANDRQRIVRAWEVLQATGEPLSRWQALAPAAPPGLRFLTFVLLPERAALYRACDDRFTGMLEHGAMAEVKRTLDRYPGLYRPGAPPPDGGAKALGFWALARHAWKGSEVSAETIAAAQQQTRNYAKRQGTWFRNQMLNENFMTPEAPDMQFPESSYAGISQKIRDFGLTGHP